MSTAPKTQFVRPGTDPVTKEPFLVRMPEKPGTFLPAEGANVPLNEFWIRRLKDGSVVKAEPPKGKRGSNSANQE